MKNNFLIRFNSKGYSSNRPTLGIVIFFVLLFIYAINSKNFFSMFQIKDIILNSTLATALAALGAGLVIISGGFDMSAGATVVLVNVVLVTAHTNGLPGGLLVWSIICLLIGATIGMINGFLVAVVRLPSIIATLSMMFILLGVALLVMPVPSGSISDGYIELWTGAIGGVIPITLVCFIILFLVVHALQKSSFGTNIYSVGSDEHASYLNGIPVTRIKMSTYIMAGFCYGLSGLYATAYMGSGDPTLGAPMLLSIFAAVVVGGIKIGGGRGSFSGSIIGAGIMNLTITTLFVLGVSSYWGPIANGIVLIGAVVLTAYLNK
jgi:ribose transport system permease protein